jgi:hypothetical protein
MMDDDNEESSITERSIIANANNVQSLVATAEAEDEIQAIKVGMSTLNMIGLHAVMVLTGSM